MADAFERQRKPRRLTARLTLAVAAVLVSLAIVEAGVRLVAPQSLSLSQRTASGMVLHVPYADVEYVGPEFRHRVRINSLGLRDDETTIEKPLGTSRILVLGDSYAEARQVPLEETFAERLEQRLRDRFPNRRWEVVNLGVAGYGTAEELRLFDELGRRFEPDVVVVEFCVGNDFVDNARSRLIRWRDGVLEEVPPRPLTTREWLVARVKEHAASRFHAVQLARRVYHELRNPTIARDAAVAAQARRESLLAVGVDPGLEEARRITDVLFERLQRRVTDAGARLLVFAVPLRAQVNDDEWRAVSGAIDTSAARDAPQRWLVETTRRHGIPFLDLLTPLRSARSEGEVYYRFDGHFNARGHEIAANEIFAALLREGLLPE